MRILVDTHVFLWAITDDDRLSKAYRAYYLDNENELYLSVVSIWEMLIKSELGRLPLPSPAANYILKQMDQNRVSLLPIRPSHLAELESLPTIHKDPFDRMTVAQATVEKMSILSEDPVLRTYNVRIL